jgi:hypothetical protein
VPASYKILITLSIHLQHSFLEIHLYYVEGAYINRPARSKYSNMHSRPADAAGRRALLHGGCCSTAPVPHRRCAALVPGS